jgi:uroporphyrinogen decarboxylase
MSPILDCIKNNKTTQIPIWLMRQAGRYLPEFRKIREKNPNFINLCLDKNLSSEITLQPLERFKLDAAIIFSDILMLPYALNQRVEFKKKIGPKLGEINLENMNQVKEIDFVEKLKPIYESLKITSKNKLMYNKDLIGFVGAPWTLLVYMINKKSPKGNLLINKFNVSSLTNNLLQIIEKFLKIHIKKQIEAGATIIQIFDSWAGLLEDRMTFKYRDMYNYVYEPNKRLVNFVKGLNIPVICFPRGINNYKEFCDFVKPDVINIDYKTDPKNIKEKIDITIQGGLDPKILLTDKNKLNKEVLFYLDIFKDHPYIFNLGHGVLPETKPGMVEELVNIVKNYS